MTSKHKNFIKALAIVVFIIIGGFEALFFYVNSLVKPETYQQQVLDAIKKQTGKDVKIHDNVRFSLLPSPKLVLVDLEIDNGSTSVSSTPDFYIEKVEIYISPMSLFSDHIRLSGVNLVHPKLSLERASDNTIHWEWLNIKLLKALNINGGKGMSMPLFINGGVLSYKDSINKKDILIENIEARTVSGAQISLNGSMKSAGHSFDFIIDSKTSDLPVADSQFPLNIRISNGAENVLQLQSVIDSSADYPKVVGNFNLDTNDIEQFVTSPSQDNNTRKINLRTADDKMPMAVSGMWELESDVIQMKNITIKGLNSQGEGSADISWDNWYPTISADLNFAYIDYLMWKRLLDKRMNSTVQINHDDFMTEDVPKYNFNKENPLPENIEIKLDIKAQKILFGKEEWKDTSLNAVLDGGTFTINQCDINLDGDGLLSLFGVISQGGNGDLRFEGNVDAKGKSLHKAISMFYSSAKDLPSIGEGNFSISANLYINSEQVRLFEAKSTINDMPVTGTMTVYLEEQPIIDLKIKLNDINLDSIRDQLRRQKIEEENRLRKEAENAKENVYAAPEDTSSISFDWLKNLSTRLDVKVYIDGFTFMDRKGERVTFSIYAYGGDFRLSNLQFVYPEGVNEVSCYLDVRGEQPHISLWVNADQIDTSYFSAAPQVADNLSTQHPDTTETQNNEESKKGFADYPIPLEWMNNFNGVLDITLRKLVHKNILVEKIKLQARLEGKNLSIQKLVFVYSQAQSYVVGTLYGGKVPGLLISFTMANADIYEMLQPLTGLANITGYTNLSGTVATTGWNLREWLGQMDAKLLIAARGVKVQGINLAGVSNVVDVAHSSADVFNNVNNVLTKGTTEFSVDGSLSIKEGELRVPSLTLRTGLITGTVVGNAKLESLTGQFSTLFRFANLSSDVVPTMIIQIAGNLNKPDIKVDTASLEYFVARRNVGK